MTTAFSPEIQSISPPHSLDDIDRAANFAAERYCVDNGERILEHPVEELTKLFDKLTDNYQQRKMHYRVDYGDEVIHVTGFGTRSPDRTKLDQTFSEFVVYKNSPNQKEPEEAMQRNITMLDDEAGYQRLIIEAGHLTIVDQTGRSIEPAEADRVILEAVMRARRAEYTYQARDVMEQAEADWDALGKLQKRTQISA